MLLSSLSEFDYNIHTSSSNPAGSPPAGESSSGTGNRYLNMLSGHFSFGGGRRRSSKSPGSGRNSPGPGRSDNERLDSNSRPSDTREGNERPRMATKPSSYRLSRDNLRDFALGTLQVLDEGEYFPPGAVEPYELMTKIKWTSEHTRYYGPDAGEGGEMWESEFVRINEDGGHQGNEEKEERVKMGAGEKDKNASFLDAPEQENGSGKAAATASEVEKKQIDDNSSPKVRTTAPPDSKKSATSDAPIYVGEYSTLIGARKVYVTLVSNLDPSPKKIGVLNFASAKKPGGGFMNGSQAQEESIARASTLFPSLITDAASQFYTHYRSDPSNGYYTHAMVYSPAVILLRDDNGEWRSPVEVDVLTSAAVNAGEIRRGIEREERRRRERVEMEYWKRKGEERKREVEKARERQIKEKKEEKKKKEEAAKAKKEKAELKKLKKGTVKSEETKETEKGKKKDSGSKEEETSVEQEKVDAEVEKEKEKEKEKWEEADAEESEENREEKASDSPESGSISEGEMKKAEEQTESKGISIQDDHSQPRASPEVNQESNSLTTISHPLSSETQPLQAPNVHPDFIYTVALSKAEAQIEHTMYTRISRILHLFQLHQASHLILGSFGTGVFQNNIHLVANIFADLLVKPDGRFKNVFETVVFAILGKETVRIFGNVFSRVDRDAQRKRGGRGGKACVFLDDDREDGEVREEEEEGMMRMMRWEARRTALAEAAQAEADAASFAAAEAEAAAYAAAQAELDAASFAAAEASFAAAVDAQAHAGAASAFQTDHAPAYDDGIGEDEKMISSEDDEKVDLAVEETAKSTTVPKVMITDFEVVEMKSPSTSYGEDQDGDFEML